KRLAELPQNGHERRFEKPLRPQTFDQEPARVVALAGLLTGFPPSCFGLQLAAPPAFHGAHDGTGVPQEVRIQSLVFGTGLPQAGLQIVRVLDEGGWGMALFVTGQRTFAEAKVSRYVP